VVFGCPNDVKSFNPLHGAFVFLGRCLDGFCGSDKVWFQSPSRGFCFFRLRMVCAGFSPPRFNPLHGAFVFLGMVGTWVLPDGNTVSIPFTGLLFF